MGDPEAQRVIEQFSRRVQAGERIASNEMIRRYGSVYRQLQKDTTAILKIKDQRQLKRWEVMRLQRMRDLESNFLRLYGGFATNATGSVVEAQQIAIRLAEESAERATWAGLPNGINKQNMANIGTTWNRIPSDAFTAFVGISGDGAPLGRLLAELGPKAAKQITEEIGDGIALGYNSKKIGRNVRNKAGMPLTRALTIARTETNRAYREASRLSYAVNSGEEGLVRGYRRLSARSENTCIACLAEDGTFHETNELMPTHPNCRCTLVPETVTYRDLGLDVDMPPPPENARDWFGRQSQARQEKILGAERLGALNSGKLPWENMMRRTTNKTWGSGLSIVPVSELRRTGTI
tara:strand:+ start:572 stop:1624 length:1053 start_codon:yes stop_codon:yes gene_type:complete